MLTLIKACLQWKTRPGVIRRAVSRTKFPRPPKPPRSEELVVAAAQMELLSTCNIREYVEWLFHPLRAAQSRGAQLFLYPEYITLPLLGLLPQGIGNRGEDIDPGEVLKFMAPYLGNVYQQVFSALARRAGIFIGGGSTIRTRDNRYFNSAWLYNPRGEAVLTQNKINLVPRESQWGLDRGSQLEVIPLPGDWRVAMPVCMDATYFEVFRLGGKQDADLMLVPIADLNPEYSEHMALRGIWSRVQEEPVFGVKSALVGELAGFKFTGRSGIYGPGPITADGDGVIAETKNPEEGDLIMARLSRHWLKEIKEKEEKLPRGVFREQLKRSYKKIINE